MSEPTIRLTRPTDINNIVDLDLKCYVYPLCMADWQDLVGTSGQDGSPRVVMVEVLQKPVAFGMWQHDKDKGITTVIRLGALEPFRRAGVSKILLTNCIKGSRTLKIKRLQVVAPEIHCRPGDPDDISEFLLKSGFHPTGDILNEYKTMYGDLVDGFVFERKI